MLINSSILAIKYCIATILEFWKRHKIIYAKRKELMHLIFFISRILQFTERSALLNSLHFSAPNTYKICGHLNREWTSLNLPKLQIQKIWKRITEKEKGKSPCGWTGPAQLLLCSATGLSPSGLVPLATGAYLSASEK